MKRTALFLSGAFLISCAGKSVVEPVAPKPTPSFFMTKPLPTAPVSLVVDESFVGAKLKNYRKNTDLKVSGSATFGPAALKELSRPLKKSKTPLYIFDLRQEAHGLINDLPVSWDAERNWGQADLNHEESIRRERRLLADLHIGDKLGSADIKSIETEESMVRTAGHQYVRLTVLDFLRPSDSEVDLFIDSLRDLPDRVWIHFHCRDGGHRTTTFMVLYDMLINAQHASFEDILKRNMELSQDPNFLAMTDAKDWRYPYQKEQAEFIREFYKYAKAHPRGEGAHWSEWAQMGNK